MKPDSRSLKTSITLWCAGLFTLLYLAAMVLVLVLDLTNSRRELHVLLHSQAEALASYHAATEQLDFPELLAVEHEPRSVWLRLSRQGQTVAATPGFPADLPPLLSCSDDDGAIEVFEHAASGPLARVCHGVWRHPGMVVEAISSAHLLGRSLARLGTALGLAPFLLVPLAALGGRVLAARALRPVEKLLASIDGIDTRSLKTRLETPPGTVQEIAQLAHDFNRLLDRVENANLAMRHFTADASHELRTPIAILRTSIEVALRRPRPLEEYQQLAARCLQEISRIERTVESLLILARDAPDAPFVPPDAPVDLSHLVLRTLDTVRPMANERGVELASRVAPGVAARGDEDLLGLAIVNLLDNAIKYTPAGKRVQLFLEQDETTARLVVEDEGPGVAPDDRLHLFDRFYRGQRGPAATNGHRRGGGSGIGLAVVRWVLESHGGSARLLDGDAGAAFELTVPIAPDRPSEEHP